MDKECDLLSNLNITCMTPEKSDKFSFRLEANGQDSFMSTPKFNGTRSELKGSKKYYSNTYCNETPKFGMDRSKTMFSKNSSFS